MSRQPHDKLFKRIFKNPEYAAEELRELLPPALVSALDWDSLEQESGSYVDEALRDTYSDLVFSARAGHRDFGNGSALIGGEDFAPREGILAPSTGGHGFFQGLVFGER